MRTLPRIEFVAVILTCAIAAETLVSQTQTSRASSQVAGSPEFFITDEARTTPPNSVFTQEQVKKARRAKDSRPASADPEGNWGVPSQGFQLSLRFNKASFTNGEPVIASVILRNVSDRTLDYPYEYAPDNREITFNVLRGETRVYGMYDLTPGASFADKVRAAPSGHGWIRSSPPGTQRKFFVNLDKIYSLTNTGEYTVFAKRTIRNQDSNQNSEVVSGKATFRISELSQ